MIWAYIVAGLALALGVVVLVWSIFSKTPPKPTPESRRGPIRIAILAAAGVLFVTTLVLQAIEGKS